MQVTGGSTPRGASSSATARRAPIARAMLVARRRRDVEGAGARLHTDGGRRRQGQGHALLRRAGRGGGEARRRPSRSSSRSAKEWKLIGKPIKRLDTPEKITGKAKFGIDVHFEGLRTAVVARAPGLRRHR